MCPVAQARNASPGTATTAPTIRVNGRGRAKTKKSAAQAKPSGTRQRCIHVPPLANRYQFRRYQCVGPPQTICHGMEHAFDVNVHADPLRTRPAMTVDSTTDIVPLDTDVG